MSAAGRSTPSGDIVFRRRLNADFVLCGTAYADMCRGVIVTVVIIREHPLSCREMYVLEAFRDHPQDQARALVELFDLSWNYGGSFVEAMNY